MSPTIFGHTYLYDTMLMFGLFIGFLSMFSATMYLLLSKSIKGNHES